MKEAMMIVLLILCICACNINGMGSDAKPKLSKYYCIIGAGPAGLQMGHYLERAGRDYVIFEQSNQSGNFFVRYPRHRKLISINKRNTGRTNKEFNMRHDWNSLLSDDESLLVGNYFKDYFPPADVLLDYLRDYQQKLGINVQFNTKIQDLLYHPASDRLGDCRYTMKDQHRNLYCCRNVFMGIGWSQSKVPSHIPGIEYLDTYDTISIDPSDFEAQSVLIFGMGNSAFETALAIYGRANVVHLAGRRRIRLSWETHYVGDIRGLNNEILDNYMLKSLDGILEIDINQIKFSKRSDGKIQLIASGMSTDHLVDKNPVRDGYDRIILCMGFEWSNSIFHKSMKVGSSTLPKVPKNKFPDIGYDYQSTRYPGLFFIGTLSHSLDFRKSAGGFIHGFRYTVRGLYRYLEWQNFNVKWPAVSAPIEHLPSMLLKRSNEASGIYQMFSHLCDLAIYDRETNRFTYIEEFPVSLLPYLYDYTGWQFIPSKHSAFVLVLEYGRGFSKPGVDHFREDRAQGSVPNAHLSNFLHPVIYYYDSRLPTEDQMKDLRISNPVDDPLPKPDGIHHILEDFTSQFDGPTMHLMPVRRFVEHFVNRPLRTFTLDRCASFGLSAKSNWNQEEDNLFPTNCRPYVTSPESSLMFF